MCMIKTIKWIVGRSHTCLLVFLDGAFDCRDVPHGSVVVDVIQEDVDDGEALRAGASVRCDDVDLKRAGKRSSEETKMHDGEN